VAAPPIYLARHGQTDYNAEPRFQGRLAVPLNDTGREQARELAEQAASKDFVALWCSPLARARQTADIVAARLGLAAVEDERLVETDAGDWTDRPFTEVRSEQPELFAAFAAGRLDFAFPGGESFAEQGARVAGALADVERGARPALVVCHGVVIRLALTGRRPQGPPGALPAATVVPNGALIALPPLA